LTVRVTAAVTHLELTQEDMIQAGAAVEAQNDPG
jgi:hypothetical protein